MAYTNLTGPCFLPSTRSNPAQPCTSMRRAHESRLGQALGAEITSIAAGDDYAPASLSLRNGYVHKGRSHLPPRWSRQTCPEIERVACQFSRAQVVWGEEAPPPATVPASVSLVPYHRPDRQGYRSHHSRFVSIATGKEVILPCLAADIGHYCGWLAVVNINVRPIPPRT